MEFIRRCIDYKEAITYYTRAEEVFSSVKGYESYKLNIFYSLVTVNTILGQVQEAEKNLKKLEKMLNDGLVDKGDISFIFIAKSRLFFVQEKDIEALEQINKTIITFVENGVDPNDLLLANTYILKAEILNSLAKYQEAYEQAEQLYKMHKPTKKENHEIFGRIYTQMARSELGVGKIEEANDHIAKAIAIFLADEDRNPKDADYSEDPDLAAAYVVQGDIFFAQDNLKQAIESYKKAYVIYFYLYRGNSKNVAHMSYLYTQGAKASCMAKDLYNYKAFGITQVEEFGVDHPSTTAMFEYCKQYNMDLWAEEN